MGVRIVGPYFVSVLQPIPIRIWVDWRRCPLDLVAVCQVVVIGVVTAAINCYTPEILLFPRIRKTIPVVIRVDKDLVWQAVCL